MKPESGKAAAVEVAALQAKVDASRSANQKVGKLLVALKSTDATPGVDLQPLVDRARELLAESPSNTRLLMSLGVMQFKQNQFDEAAASFSEANRYAPADPVIYYQLGRVHEQLGKPKRALRDYDRARRLDFTSANLRKAYYRLEKQVHPDRKSAASVSKADVEKMLSECAYDELVCLRSAALKGLMQVVEDVSKYPFFPRRAPSCLA